MNNVSFPRRLDSFLKDPLHFNEKSCALSCWNSKQSSIPSGGNRWLMRSQKVHSSNNKREEDLQLHTVVTNQESKVVVLPILTARSHTCMSFSILGLFVVAFAKKRSREMEILCLQKKKWNERSSRW